VKCRKCGGTAALELRRHNAAFCSPHFIEFFRKQVAEAVHRHRMFSREETIMVAVSGGKDSLALWDVLIEDGYQTSGLYLDLGIFDYSVESKARAEKFATDRGVPAGRAHEPNRAVISRRASSTVTAPTTAITVVSERACSP